MNGIEIEQLKAELLELQNWKKSLEASHSIPLNIDQSFRARFVAAGVSASSKSSTSENVTVHEGGSSNYSVMGPPDAFAQIRIGTTVYYIPLFT